MGAAAHVNDVAVRRRAVAVGNDAHPSVIEMPDGFAEEVFEKADQLRSIDDAIEGGIVLGDVGGDGGKFSGMGPGLDGGGFGIKQAGGGQTVRQGAARGVDQIAVEKPGDEKIAVGFEKGPQHVGLADGVIRPDGFAKGVRPGVEFAAEGQQAGRDGHDGASGRTQQIMPCLARGPWPAGLAPTQRASAGWLARW